MNKIIYFSSDSIENFNKLCNKSIDFIFSNAVLEHVFDLNLAIKKISMLLKKGGYTIHQVDLRDHFYIREKCYLNFLRYSPKFWKFFGDTNRCRISEYINLFEKYNFEIIAIKSKKIRNTSKLNIMKERFFIDYRNLSNEDLSIIGFNIFAKKK